MDLEHEKRLTEIETRSKSNTRRIEDVEKRQDKLDALVSAVNVLADREKRVEQDVSEIKDDVKDIKEKPAKKWEGVVEKILFTVVGGVVTFLLVKLGM